MESVNSSRLNKNMIWIMELRLFSLQHGWRISSIHHLLFQPFNSIFRRDLPVIIIEINKSKISAKSYLRVIGQIRLNAIMTPKLEIWLCQKSYDKLKSKQLENLLREIRDSAKRWEKAWLMHFFRMVCKRYLRRFRWRLALNFTVINSLIFN